jgi:hypothetical protein
MEQQPEPPHQQQTDSAVTTATVAETAGAGNDVPAAANAPAAGAGATVANSLPPVPVATSTVPAVTPAATPTAVQPSTFLSAALNRLLASASNTVTTAAAAHEQQVATQRAAAAVPPQDDSAAGMVGREAAEATLVRISLSCTRAHRRIRHTRRGRQTNV